MILAGCAREQVADQVSAEQLNLVKEMKSNYLQAKAYQDSLVSGHQANLEGARIAYFDRMYHHYDGAFTNCHNSYEHNPVSADHSHSGQGTVQMHRQGGGVMGSGMMGEGDCTCCTNGGHAADIHDQMDALHRVHEQHHP